MEDAAFLNKRNKGYAGHMGLQPGFFELQPGSAIVQEGVLGFLPLHGASDLRHLRRFWGHGKSWERYAEEGKLKIASRFG